MVEGSEGRAARGALVQARVSVKWLVLIDEWRDGSRDVAGDRPSRSDCVRAALKDFLGRELARIRSGK